MAGVRMQRKTRINRKYSKTIRGTGEKWFTSLCECRKNGSQNNKINNV